MSPADTRESISSRESKCRDPEVGAYLVGTWLFRRPVEGGRRAVWDG